MNTLDQEEILRLTVLSKERLTKKAEKFSELINVDYGRITIRHQRTRWGSCSSKGNLNFNCLLMLTPEYVQDYVVVHELAHRKEMNHSSKYWSIVESVLPDYKDAKKWLKENGKELIQRMDT